MSILSGSRPYFKIGIILEKAEKILISLMLLVKFVG